MKFLLIILASCQIAFCQHREAREFEGCYELRNDGHFLSLSYGQFPRRFQLKAERDRIEGFVATNLDLGAHRGIWIWYMTRDGDVEISPGGGWITDGWFMHLSRVGSDLRGTATYWTDTDSGSTMAIVAHPVACPAE